MLTLLTLLFTSAVWIDDSGAPHSEAGRMLVAINSVDDDALDPEEYHRTEIARLLRDPHRDPVALDSMLTDAYVTLYAHQHGGRVDPALLVPRTISATERAAIIERLERTDLTDAIDELQPAHPDYPVLKALRHLYRFYAARDPTNTAVADRALQIEINMETRRWMPTNEAVRNVVVNIAAFELTAYELGQPVVHSRVIVGTKYRRTPLFSSTMTQVIANPQWFVPARIAAEEMLPQAEDDPTFFQRFGFRITERGQLVQRAGPRNPLGRVKLQMPNKYDVYLHDTPIRRLFERDLRTFSHGCIRVENAEALGAWALGEGGEERLQSAIATGRTTSLKVPDPPTVHLVYWTVRLDEGGTIEFHHDIYGRDAQIARALQSTAPAGS